MTFQKNSLFKKFIFSTILVIFFFVANFGVWQGVANAQVGGAGGAGAGGALCLSNVIVAYPLWGKQMAECLDSILLGLWKTVLFPMLKKITFSLITKGDFGITWESIKDWFYYDLVFQTAEQILNKLGLSLCAQLSVALKLVLYQTISPIYEPPECTFQRSQLAQIIDDAITKGGDAAWARFRQDFFNMFYFSTQPQYNQFAQYWLIKGAIGYGVTKEQEDIKMELLFSNGFLGSRDCSYVPQKDRNKSGKIEPSECTVKTPGRWIAERVFGEQKNVEEAAFGSQVLADLTSLTGTMIDILLNQAITGLFNKLEETFRSQKEEAERDYIESLRKEVGQNQPPFGGNKAIEFPAEKPGYRIP